MRRIDLDVLYAAIGIGAAAPNVSTDQSIWTSADVIPGELLGQIRVWLTHPDLIGPSPMVRNWRDGFPHATLGSAGGLLGWLPGGLKFLVDPAEWEGGHVITPPPRIADPAPIRVPDPIFEAMGQGWTYPTQLKLFFASIEVVGTDEILSSEDGYGMWCATAMPALADGGRYLHAARGIIIPAEGIEPIFGVDFLICTAPLGINGIPRDMFGPVVVDGENVLLYFDPGPVKDPVDGSWRVHAGGNALTLFTGDARDGDYTWEDAWCGSRSLPFEVVDPGEVAQEGDPAPQPAQPAGPPAPPGCGCG